MVIGVRRVKKKRGSYVITCSWKVTVRREKKLDG